MKYKFVMPTFPNAQQWHLYLKGEKKSFTMFSAIRGFVASSNNAMIAGSASVWWFDIKTIL